MVSSLRALVVNERGASREAEGRNMARVYKLYPLCESFGLVVRFNPPHIRDADLKEKLPQATYCRLNEWLTGQTTFTEGPYPWDVEQFLSGDLRITD